MLQFNCGLSLGSDCDFGVAAETVNMLILDIFAEILLVFVIYQNTVAGRHECPDDTIIRMEPVFTISCLYEETVVTVIYSVKPSLALR